MYADTAPATETRVLAADADAIATAAKTLAAGSLVAFPTETVYGLGANAANGEAVARLYAAKGRPAFNPLIAHVATLELAHRLGRFSADAETLARAFWPGPLTLVLPRQPGARVSDLALAGLDSVAVRMPAHPVARALLAAFGGAVVAPSANQSGHISPTDAAHVVTDLQGRIDLVLDGGACPIGLESTIVSCVDTPTLLRSGGLAREEIERVLGHPLARSAERDDEAPLAPGMLASHYAPRARVRLNALAPEPGEAFLAFGLAPPPSGAVLNLSPRGDLVEAAANVFSHLRALDASGTQRIAVMTIPNEGLGEAINDRLLRAAAPRPEGYK
jgi:L-threonylcarbamoyladenylate synthase